jgi:hypothetical protein
LKLTAKPGDVPPRQVMYFLMPTANVARPAGRNDLGLGIIKINAR